MVEIWSIGYEKRTAEGGLISDEAHLYKKRNHSAKPGIPAFQYSGSILLPEIITWDVSSTSMVLIFE